MRPLRKLMASIDLEQVPYCRIHSACVLHLHLCFLIHSRPTLILNFKPLDGFIASSSLSCSLLYLPVIVSAVIHFHLT